MNQINRMNVQVKHILVATDFSSQAKKAFDFALLLAARLNASLTLMHVVELTYEIGDVDFPKIEASLRAEAEKAMAALQSEAEREGIAIQLHLRSGWPFGGKRPYIEIVEQAKALGPDMLVIGTQGRTGLDHLLLGSTAERVLRHAPCPVLIVRPPQGV